MENKYQTSPALLNLKPLKQVLSLRKDIEFSLLFGSRARGDSHELSDWDIAILFKDNTSGWDNLGKQEEIRHLLSLALCIPDNKIDIVDLYRSELGINATIVDEGIPITSEKSLVLANFYQRIWANLEDYYWNLEHVL